MADPGVTRQPGRIPRLAGTVLGPLWETTFRDPVREGRLRFRGLSPAERQAARAALAALVVILGSAVLAGAWRRGDLEAVDTGGGILFVPPGILGVTIVGFAVAWLALTWGALRGSAPVRLAVAAGFLLVNATLSLDAIYALGEDRWILEHGRLLQELGYWTPAAVLAVAASTTRLIRVDRWVVLVGRVGCAAGVLLLFGSILWAQSVSIDVGRETFIPSMVAGALQDLHLFVAPLVFVSAVAVVDFALDVSTSVATPVSRLRLRWLVTVVLALALAKLWHEVAGQLDYWRAILTHQPQAVVRTTLCVVALGVLAYIVTRFRRSEDSLAAKEDLTFGGALVFTAPFTIQGMLLTLGVLVAAHSSHDSALSWSTDFPANWLNSWGLLILAVVAVPSGVALMRRSHGGLGDELGSGLIVVGAWDAVALGVTVSGVTFGFAYRAVDVVVTVGVLVAVGVVLLHRRWRLDEQFLLSALTVLLFSWLVTSRGDYISFAGGLVGLSATVVVVFGVVWTLLSGSSFTASSSRWLPQPARPLLFVGYILLSVAILAWDETTHAATSDTDALTAYYFMAIPLAAWLLGRRVISRPDRAEPAAADD